MLACSRPNAGAIDDPGNRPVPRNSAKHAIRMSELISDISDLSASSLVNRAYAEPVRLRRMVADVLALVNPTGRPRHIFQHIDS